MYGSSAIAFVLSRGVDHETAEPDGAVFFVYRPHDMTDDFPFDLDRERMPVRSVMSEAQVVGDGRDELLLVRSRPNPCDVPPIGPDYFD